jgi:hypothetical protein
LLRVLLDLGRAAADGRPDVRRARRGVVSEPSCVLDDARETRMPGKQNAPPLHGGTWRSVRRDAQWLPRLSPATSSS